MNNEQPYNTFMGDGELPIQPLPPAYAWDDMRRRLDEEMPETALPIPGNVINIDNGLLRGITSLFTLLLITTIALLFTAGTRHNTQANHNANTSSLTNKPTAATHTINSITLADSTTKQKIYENAGSVKPENSFEAGKSIKMKIAVRGKAVNTNAALQGGLDSSAGDNTYLLKDQSNNPVPENKEAQPKDTALHNSINKPASPTQPPGGEEEKKEEEAIKWQAGLSWQAQLPFSGAKQYFAGSNASSQPYRILLPSAWVSLQVEKNLLEAEINPFSSTVYNGKLFLTTIKQVNGQTATETQMLNKLFGVSAALRYSYNVQGNWWLGGAVQAKLLTKGLVTVKTSIDSAASPVYYQSFGAINDTDWANISTFQIRTDVQLMYMRNRWSAGVRAGIYFTQVAQKNGSGRNPLEVELFYRMRLWGSKK